MICLKCGNEYINKTGSLKMKYKNELQFVVSKTNWLECPGCKEKLLSPDTLRDIEEAEDKTGITYR